MKMTCPHCGVIGSAYGPMPGEKVRCPQCDKVFRVMEQKIACPHCGVAGSAGDSLFGTKLRCPRCEKVFLLTQDRLTGPLVSDVEIAGAEEVGFAAEASGSASLAGDGRISREPAELVVEPL